MPSKQELNRGFEIGEWEVLPAQGVMRSGDREEKPEPKVIEVLVALASRDGDLVTREELIDEVWDGRPTSDEPINRCLSQLRGHLGDRTRPYKYVETLTRRGYRLNQPVRLRETGRSTGGLRRRRHGLRNQGRFWILVPLLVVTSLVVVLMRSGLFTPSGTGYRSIGVMPFENLSTDEADQYLVSGFKEELVKTLHNVPEFTIKRSQASYPDLDTDAIAELLGVDDLLYGALQHSGDTLKVTYRVERGSTGEVISAGDVTGNVEDVFDLQGQLAVLVRNDLLGESPQQLISATHHPNPKAYDRYMRGLYAFERRGRGRVENLDSAIELFQQSMDLDPLFGPAYLSLATAYAVLPDYHSAPLAESHRLALETVQRGIEVDPSIRAAAGAVSGFVYHKQHEWSLAEEGYRRATSAAAVDSNAFVWYSLMLAGVGRLNEAREQILKAQRIDPSSAVINSRVAIVYAWLGDEKNTAEYYRRADKLGAGGETHVLVGALQLIRAGELEQAEELTTRAVSMAGGATDWIAPVYAALADPDVREPALDALDSASQARRIDPRLDILARTLLGDIDGAMQVALSYSAPGQGFDMDILFLPELRSLREHPAFPDLLSKLGITKYWQEKGCSWGNDTVHCPATL